MPEVKMEVTTYSVKMMCECGGFMESTGSALLIMPAKYPHICNRCEREETFDLKYPYVEYEEHVKR